MTDTNNYILNHSMIRFSFHIFFHFSQLSIQVANPICLVLQPSVASQALLTYLEQK